MGRNNNRIKNSIKNISTFLDVLDVIVFIARLHVFSFIHYFNETKRERERERERERGRGRERERKRERERERKRERERERERKWLCIPYLLWNKLRNLVSLITRISRRWLLNEHLSCLEATAKFSRNRRNIEDPPMFHGILAKSKQISRRILEMEAHNFIAP